MIDPNLDEMVNVTIPLQEARDLRQTYLKNVAYCAMQARFYNEADRMASADKWSELEQKWQTIADNIGANCVAQSYKIKR